MLLKATGISCERGDKLLFDSFNLSVEAGEILQLAGPNGAGKTTLLRAICGIFDAQIDTLVWCGIAVTSPLQYADELLYLGHKPAIRPHLTLQENLQWYCHLSQNAHLDRLPKVIAEVQLSGYEMEATHSLSAGQKRRLALARLRLVDCKLWVLDEPFASLDAAGVEMLSGWIKSFVKQGGSVVYSTHQPVEFDGCKSRMLHIGKPHHSKEALIDEAIV